MKAVKFLVLSFFLASSSKAFTLMLSNDSSMRGWPSSTVVLNVNTANCPAGVDVVGLVSEAAAVWNDISTSNVKVKYGTATTSTTYGNPTTVFCDTTFNADPAVRDVVPGAASIQTTSGVISGGILSLNASNGAANIAQYDHEKLLIILAHEIGHVLGLGHSEDSQSLMYYNASLKTSLGLSQDDMDGMSYLYPKDELAGDPMMGCGIVRELPPPSGGMMAVLSLLLLLPLAVYASLRFRPLKLSN